MNGIKWKLCLISGLGHYISKISFVMLRNLHL